MPSSGDADKTSLPKTSEKKAPGAKTNNAEPSQPVYASDAVAMVEKRSRSAADGAAAMRQLDPRTSMPGAAPTTERESLNLTAIPTGVPPQDRPRLALRMAEEAFAKTGSWVVFYREMLAPGGVVDQLYESAEARRYFETTSEFAELLEMVAAMRSQDDSKSGTYEPERVITVRLPRSMHEGVVREAKELELSINKYCLTKLLQPANSRFTPVETGARRGRRPGPQITLERVKIRGDEKASEKSSEPRKRTKPSR
ncbi:hypothetical protein SAMN06265222_11157 [Neorhodopirellula lusitana]|uniref:Uncharacterized protein n=1 Tax=Neorhodopirellula lusitana TaxID=445327 RepID=A0ABY1QDM9_9BACT|nr:hypothetical protein [Neorhodopirellula lusitana]SMP68418.1 hypothetical protein SAMN06265222_11157 [Neorhodopirellula lusitana]